MSIIYEPHDCGAEFDHNARRMDNPPRGSIWECKCGTRLVKGKWISMWRKVRWFDRLPDEVKADR